ncbi:unnamed protein product [Symbiodinium necroappetens]|uniref:Uncharacterized protein n=1 Tax=Symbiodinium necroappetens TaxID=1628268 RepID=A0A812VBK4_9DINO|nr:unnamed protein product [Symbiodinium necroappetens]
MQRGPRPSPRPPQTPATEADNNPDNAVIDLEIQDDPGRSWIPEAPPQTFEELLQALTKVVHNLLQASFAQPSEAVTSLAYRACSYLTQMQALFYQQNPQGETPQRNAAQGTDPTAIVFALDNPLIEVEATLAHMAQNHGDFPRRHLYHEIARVEQLLKEAKQVLVTWGRDPDAPGAHEGTASIRNALDALDWSHLAVEEGSIVQIGETLQQALGAVQRCRGYMETLMKWLQAKFEDTSGSPVKKRRMGDGNERASGSNQSPVFDLPHTQHHDATAPVRHPPEPHPRQGVPAGQDSGVPQASGASIAREATPYAILRAQEILREAMPFAEQELAHFLAEAHAHLAGWTQSLWGHPVRLVPAPDHRGCEATQTQLEQSGDVTPMSQADTVICQPVLPRGRTPTTTMRRTRAPSHRRRRLQAALADTSESDEGEDDES